MPVLVVPDFLICLDMTGYLVLVTAMSLLEHLSFLCFLKYGDPAELELSR